MKPPYITNTLLLLLSLFLLHLSPCTSSQKDPTSQLLNFKQSLPNPSLLHDWLPNNNPCSFTGITCNQTTITSIHLTFIPLNINLTLIATHLLTIDHLQTLTLKSTNLTASSPISLSHSKCTPSLTTIDLSLNTLSSSFSDWSFLSSCSSLTSLNLSKNGITFDSPKFSFSSSLRLLDLSGNKIFGPGFFPWLINHELEFLSLAGNKITGEVDFSGYTSLKYLNLSANNFSVSIPLFGECSSLQSLDLSTNKFFGDITRTLSPCKHLLHLNVSDNQFTGPVPFIPSGSIKFLYLAKNHFAGKIPAHLADHCSTLVELDLSSNNLTGPIPREFGACSLLTSFDISNNMFSGELPMEVITEMSSLKELAVASNEFSGEFPVSLSKLTDLESLDLSSNNFTGTVPNWICEGEIGNNLKGIYLQNNRFTGFIPPTLSNCSNLVALDLSFNYFTGTIPPSLGSLTKLRDLILWLNQLHGEIPQELQNMESLENLILDFNDLTGSIPDGLMNCTKLNWISLSNNRLSGVIPRSIGKLSNLAILKLSNNTLSGEIPPELGDCPSLLWLDLNTNLLTGIIPPEMFKQAGKIAINYISSKPYVYIKNDGSRGCNGAGSLLEFAGISQLKLNRISTRNPCNFTRVYKGSIQPVFTLNGSMIFFDISHNNLSGPIPKEIGEMQFLFILHMSHNHLSGSIPQELGKMKNLNILDLSYNELEGQIPETMTRLSLLTELYLSNNFLSGSIPMAGQFDTFQIGSFQNNSALCGGPLPACGTIAAGANSQHKSHRRQASLAGSVAMGLLFALFCIFGLILIAVETRKRRKKKEAAIDGYIDNSHSGNGNNSGWKLTSAREALSINLSTFEKPLRKLTFADLLEATNGFHNDSLIGSGGFGDVYKAQLKDGSVVAIKKLIHVSGQGDREFTAEMETIGKIKHRNLVPLLGYCKVGEERLLVYEYMKYGSLEDVLHDPKKAGIKMNWSVRRKIAIGAARGLAFLHHSCIPHIIHRDMKSSNVLLDENLEARVSDFGMARLMSAMDTHLSVSTLAGTPGYVPPEYYQSFRCSTKGDVYSYGVVLLELLTGRRPTDSADFGDNNLVGWVKQHAKLKISDVFDQELMKEDPNMEIELLQHLKVACACLDDRPWRRPTMIQVLAMFKEIQAGSGGMDSQSTIAAEDEGFNAIEMVEMSIKEVPELSKH
ncbi:systemin receptor SR160-like [Trifolium pratense]|uniref:systemin receptor SR160-like n=1 Tax=Trifolium pratense TaxID=57577 RepID=UPI001E69652A|nr:systemin receptor SR160-like [Trifolium pratense]